MRDKSERHILEQLASAVNQGLGQNRHIHLFLENDANETRWLERETDNQPKLFAAQWNDDFHHPLHILLTGEEFGHYKDHVESPLSRLGRAMTRGFDFQGQWSDYRKAHRGQPVGQVPCTAFVNYLQNHDQVGNRPFGERMASLASEEAVRAAIGLLLLAPGIPLVFMGEEHGSQRSFPFFTDFNASLGNRVKKGRDSMFRHFNERFNNSYLKSAPHPNNPSTFDLAKLDGVDAESGNGVRWLDYFKAALEARARFIIPLIKENPRPVSRYEINDEASLRALWIWRDGKTLTLLANLSHESQKIGNRPHGNLILDNSDDSPSLSHSGILSPWSCCWYLT